MPIERSKSLLSSLFGLGSVERQRDALLDLLLMAALADGQISQRDLDRIARAMEVHPELAGADWNQVIVRATELQEDAPLFSTTRARIERHLRTPEIRRFAIRLAASFLGHPLEVEEQALLHTLADAFAIEAGERAELFMPWTDADPFSKGYRRLAYNDPDAQRSESLFDAMDHADEEEFRLLAFKLAAVRVTMNKLSESAELASFGERIKIGGRSLRIDAFIQTESAGWVARFLGTGEALHPREHVLLPKLMKKLKANVSLYVGYDDQLSPADTAALRLLDPGRVVSEKVVL